MRIQIVGTCLSAAAVRSSLHLAGIPVAENGAEYTIEIVKVDGTLPTVDGVDCGFERLVVNQIAACGQTDVILLRPGGVQSDRAVRVGVPEACAPGVEQGIVRAVVQFFMHPDYRPTPIDSEPESSTWEKVKKWFAAR